MLRMQKTQILYFGILGVSVQGTSQCWQTQFLRNAQVTINIFFICDEYPVLTTCTLHVVSRCKLYSTTADESRKRGVDIHTVFSWVTTPGGPANKAPSETLILNKSWVSLHTPYPLSRCSDNFTVTV